MVEDTGEFVMVLISAVILAEAGNFFLSGSYPILSRPWAGPLVALLLTILILVVGAVGQLLFQTF